MIGTVHVFGAGIAGLACAAAAVRAGCKVTVYEATKQAGGRCRSFSDPHLGINIDNGSHAVLGANPAVFEYLSALNAGNELVAVDDSGAIPFVDLNTGERWRLNPGKGLFPGWIFNAEKRAPETNALDYLNGLRLLIARKNKTVASVLQQTGPAWERFWEPLSSAVMNTPADEASAKLLGQALRQAMISTKGGFRCYVPRTSLHSTFVAPALTFLGDAKVPIHYSTPLSSIVEKSGRIAQLKFRSSSVDLSQTDTVVLALPPWSPAVTSAIEHHVGFSPSPIVNVHYRVDVPSSCPAMTGLTGGRGHWIFNRPGLISVTVSADRELAEQDQTQIAAILWSDVQKALNLSETPLPPYRVIVERRATPVQDCIFAQNRPNTRTNTSNLFLAGDWVDTGLPCTLESAVRSGVEAANHATSVP